MVFNSEAHATANNITPISCADKEALIAIIQCNYLDGYFSHSDGFETKLNKQLAKLRRNGNQIISVNVIPEVESRAWIAVIFYKKGEKS